MRSNPPPAAEPGLDWALAQGTGCTPVAAACDDDDDDLVPGRIVRQITCEDSVYVHGEIGGYQVLVPVWNHRGLVTAR